ncbi:MAG: ATP-dependent zinc protease [Bdellovibrionales bacterium]|nr:ATP-dependent zinc protease [Bdellovibrionales bacterium]
MKLFSAKKSKVSPITIGWWEYLQLPALSSSKIKAKIDTGAKTSALHAEDIKVFIDKGVRKVRYTLYPNQKDRKNKKTIVSKLVEVRRIKSSIGTTTLRPVIETLVDIGGQKFIIELTLVNRDLLGFRMLLGRQALKKRFLINPSRKNILRKR